MKALRALSACAFAAFAWGATPAHAHASYRASDPSDEATVQSAPASVWAEFTEPVTLDSRLEVYDPCGARVDGGDSSVTGYRITVSMDSERAGTYTVAFAVISAVDGHATQGAFTFTAVEGQACPQAEAPGDAVTPQPRAGGDGAAASGEPVMEQAASPPADPEGARPERRSRPQRPGRAARSPAAGAPSVPAARGAPAAQPGTSPAPEQADPPLGGVLAGLAVAAAIGAVGGFVYVRLLRPPP